METQEDATEVKAGATDIEKTKNKQKRLKVRVLIELVLFVTIVSASLIYQAPVTPLGFNVSVVMSSNERLETAVDKKIGPIPRGLIGSITVVTKDSGMLEKEDFTWVFQTFTGSHCFKKFDFSGANVEKNTIPDNAFSPPYEGALSDESIMTNLKEVDMPKSIVSIGQGAFSNCENLIKCDLPEGLTEIQGETFYGCTNLSIKKLPRGITVIGEAAFEECDNLAVKELPKGLIKIGDNAFNKCQNMKINALPTGLSSVGIGAFSGCGSMKVSEIPEKVKSIESLTFAYSGIEKMILNKNITYIDEGAFQDCQSLENVVFQSKTAPRIVKDAFGELSDVNVYYPDTWTAVPQALQLPNLKLIKYDSTKGLPVIKDSSPKNTNNTHNTQNVNNRI